MYLIRYTQDQFDNIVHKSWNSYYALCVKHHNLWGDKTDILFHRWIDRAYKTHREENPDFWWQFTGTSEWHVTTDGKSHFNEWLQEYVERPDRWIDPEFIALREKVIGEIIGEIPGFAVWVTEEDLTDNEIETEIPIKEIADYMAVNYQEHYFSDQLKEAIKDLED